MIDRIVMPELRRLIGSYPIVTVTGPRQSGKTTLCRAACPEKMYVSLEDPDWRALAQSDPRGFFSRLPNGAVLDEIQRVPELFSYLQGIVDEKKVNGQFVLTGSSQFELIQSITQSLAGRTALLHLLPFSLEELGYLDSNSVEEILYTGFYPRIFDQKLRPTEALGFYVATYVERDVRQLLNVRDLKQFELFIRMCAARTGQIVNLSELGNECGIKHNTVKAWLSVLEASFILHLLPSFTRNISKRLIKAPKLVFHDVGLAAYLIGITEAKQLEAHPLKGALFETFVVGEILKFSYNRAHRPRLSHFRDSTGNEVDLIIELANSVVPVEIKSSRTFSENMTTGLKRFATIARDRIAAPTVVYAGEEAVSFQNQRVLPFRNIGSELLKQLVTGQ